MKKLGKLQINPENLLKIEELISLRGGYGSGTYCCTVDCDGYHEEEFNFSSSCWPYYEFCVEWQCEWFFGQQFSNCQCNCHEYQCA